MNYVLYIEISLMFKHPNYCKPFLLVQGKEMGWDENLGKLSITLLKKYFFMLF